MNPAMSLKITACQVVVQVIMDFREDTSPTLSRYIIDLLKTEQFTAVSESIFKRAVSLYPLRITNELLSALIPPHVKEINLKDCTGVSDGGLEDIYSRCKNLRSLDMSGCDQLPRAQFFRMTAGMTGSLSSLTLNACSSVTDHGIRTLLSNLKTLRHLGLSACENVTDDMFLLDERLQFSRESQSKILGASNQTYLCDLVSVDISLCLSLTSRAVRHLTTLCGPSLQVVNLSYTEMDCTVLWYLSGYSLSSAVQLAVEVDKLQLDSVIEEALQGAELDEYHPDREQVGAAQHAMFASEEFFENLSEECCSDDGGASESRLESQCLNDFPQDVEKQTKNDADNLTGEGTSGMNELFKASQKLILEHDASHLHKCDGFENLVIEDLDVVEEMTKGIEKSRDVCSDCDMSDMKPVLVNPTANLLLHIEDNATKIVSNSHCEILKESSFSGADNADGGLCDRASDLIITVEQNKYELSAETIPDKIVNDQSKSTVSNETPEPTVSIPSATKSNTNPFQIYDSNLKSISMNGIRFHSRDLGIACLKAFFLNNQQLECMELNWNEFSDELLSILASNVLNLKKIALSECDSLTSPSLAEFFSKCRRLDRVNLQGVCFISDHALVPLVANQTVRSLNLAECNVTDSSLNMFSQRLSNQLLDLDLSWCEEITAVGIERTVKECTNLQSLSLRQCPVSLLGLDYIAENLVNLRQLNLSGINTLNDHAVSSMALALTHLETLDIGWNMDVTDLSLKAVLIHCTHLQRLVSAGIKQVTSQPFHSIISDLQRWKRSQALLRLKYQEQKILTEDQQFSSDEEYEDLYMPHRSTSYATNLLFLDLEYCDKIQDDFMAELVAICRGTLVVKDYYGSEIEPRYITCRKGKVFFSS